MPDSRLDLRMALDPVAFARALGFPPDPWQARLLWSTSPQVVVCCSRQCGKSRTAAIKALHRALFRPGSLVLLVSPSLRQSSELFRKVAEMVRDLPGVLADPPELTEDNRLSLCLANGSRIVSLPSNPDTVRGFSAVSLLIEDEAAFARDDFYTAVRPMLATTRGQLVLMSTPFGRRGHFFKAWAEGGPSWDRMTAKATECPRITPEFLASELASLGAWRYAQEYLCEFKADADGFFSYEHVQAAFSPEVKPLFGAPVSEPGRPTSAITSEVRPLFPPADAAGSSGPGGRFP